MRSTIPAGIEIRQNIHYDASPILADPTQINQLMINLCINAYHAMKQTGGILEVDLMDTDIDEHESKKLQIASPGRYLKLTIKDTGAGIDPEIQDRIFEPYFTTKEFGQGYGLGLAVVHGIVKSHNAVINVNTALGKGTTIDIFFPVIEKEESIAHEVPAGLSKGVESILFVDDEELIVEIADLLLESLGYQVKSSVSSVKALELFKSDPDMFDLVITDMSMPQMNGDKLAKSILEIRPDMPIILCTGYNELISEEKAKEIGVKAFLKKPFKRESVSKIIRKVLDER